MPDKILKCKECGKDFVFSEGEQQFYKERGLENEPQRCADCRQKRKSQRNTNGNRGGFGQGNRNSGRGF